MANVDFTSPDERNRQFIINNALERFNQMLEDDDILFKNLKFPPEVNKYAANLLECCRENMLCREAISIFFFSAFIDGFNNAMNCRIQRG